MVLCTIETCISALEAIPLISGTYSRISAVI
jgi:hypothetical protein